MIIALTSNEVRDWRPKKYYILHDLFEKYENLDDIFISVRSLVNSTDKMNVLNYCPTLIFFGCKIAVLFVSVLWGYRQESFT